MINIQSPIVLKNVFNTDSFINLKNTFNNVKDFDNFETAYSRWTISDNINPVLKNSLSSLTNLARDTFKSKTLLPTYALFAHYEGINAKLQKHKDDNACTYTIDLCVYQKTPWDLYVEGIPYTLHPNEALAYYGNDQEHWRESFPDPKNNYVAMIFFHFAEPDHWWFNKGKEYINVIRSNKY